MHTISAKCALHNSDFGEISSDDSIANNKGQIISEQNFDVLNLPKKQRNYCKNYCLCLYKMGQIKKYRFFTTYIKWYIITDLHGNVHLSFLFDPF